MASITMDELFQWSALIVPCILFYKMVSTSKANIPSIFGFVFGDIMSPYLYRVCLLLLSSILFLYFLHNQEGAVIVTLLLVCLGVAVLGLGIYMMYSALNKDAEKSIKLSARNFGPFFVIKDGQEWLLFLIGFVWTGTMGFLFVSLMIAYIDS